MPTAAAMKCLLLALGLALVCGTQAIFVPQNIKDLDLQKMWGQGLFVPQNVEDLDVQKVWGQGKAGAGGGLQGGQEGPFVLCVVYRPVFQGLSS